MSTAIQTTNGNDLGAALAEKVFVGGDLSKLTPAERLRYYSGLCESLGLNPATRPFEYLTLQGKMTLYARKDATEQLRKLHGVSITRIDKEIINDLYIVTTYARTADGRCDTDIGAVPITGLRGDNLANALMKAITKAKRRVTLSICGLGMLDETEVESIPDARAVQFEDVTPVAPHPAAQEIEPEEQDFNAPELPEEPPIVPWPEELRQQYEKAIAAGALNPQTQAQQRKWWKEQHGKKGLDELSPAAQMNAVANLEAIAGI